MEADHRASEHRIPLWSLGAEALPWDVDVDMAVLLVYCYLPWAKDSIKEDLQPAPAARFSRDIRA
ncbi:hypothetical protein HDV63DRAFT_404935 [Trichoderma sp. SZMC 28014]